LSSVLSREVHGPPRATWTDETLAARRVPTPENLAANRPVVELLTRFAEKRGATPAQLALARLLAQKPWIVPIPGTRNVDHLEENLGAVDVQLTPADLFELDGAFSKVTVHGGRMGEKYMRDVDQTQ
jgi:aryl-alcohol dehydrogenase-like predicted oxidoreductase